MFLGSELCILESLEQRLLLNGYLFPEPQFDTGYRSCAIVSADFNGDSVADLATANEGNVSVLLGGGGGMFPVHAEYAVGSFAVDIINADFNGDGVADLATANYWGYSVSVLLGNPDGTFQAQVSYAAGECPQSIATGDFDGDGDADLAAANSEDDNVSVLLNSGNGSFGTQTTFAVGADPNSMVSGDFNGDGIGDLAVTNRTGGSISILLANGDGAFGTQAVYAAGDSPIAIATGDLDDDGDTDLIATNSTDFGISVFPANGDGSFQPQVQYGTNTDCDDTVVADLDGDGILDLATIRSGTFRPISVFLGNGNGTFQPRTDQEAGGDPFRAVGGDFDGDGLTDLATLNELGDGVSIHPGNGDGTFRTEIGFIWMDHNEFSSVAPADLNGDGLDDLAIADADPVGSVFAILSNGDGTFSEQGYFDGDYLDIVSADFNGDGAADAAAVAGAGGVHVFLGNGDGTLQPPVSYASGEREARLVTIGDFDGNGTVDLAAITHSSNPGLGDGISILLGNGDGTFNTEVITSGVDNAHAIVSADFNSDGWDDLVTGGPYSWTVIYFSNGDGTFETPVELFFSDETAVLVCADLNGDGNPDIAAVDIQGRAEVFLANGDGSFNALAALTLARGVTGMVSADFDGDGNADLAATYEFGDGVAVVLGLGDGTFGPMVRYSTGFDPRDLISADFNGDGATDIAAINPYCIYILINQPPIVDIALQPGSDSGASDSDNLTNVTDPVFDITVNQAGQLDLDFDGDGMVDLSQFLPAAGVYAISPEAPLADGTYPFQAIFTDGNGRVAGDGEPVTIDTVGPAADGWRIACSHGGGVGEVLTDIAGGYVESRFQGIHKLVIVMDETMNAGSVDVSDLSVVGVAHGDQSSLITSATVAGNAITIGLSAALPDIDTYTVTLGSAVEDAAGNAAAGLSQISVKALRGDANGDGIVNSFDLLNIRTQVGRALDASTARHDINGDGVINSFDMLMARVYVGNKIT